MALMTKLWHAGIDRFEDSIMDVRLGNDISLEPIFHESLAKTSASYHCMGKLIALV